MKNNCIIAVLLLMSSVSAFAQKDRKAEIVAMNQKFMAAHAGGAAALGDLYTTDA